MDRNTLVKEIAALQRLYEPYDAIYQYYVLMMNKVLNRPQDITLYELMCMTDVHCRAGMSSTQWLKKFREFQTGR
jgi:hypothetical protein